MCLSPTPYLPLLLGLAGCDAFQVRACFSRFYFLGNNAELRLFTLPSVTRFLPVFTLFQHGHHLVFPMTCLRLERPYTLSSTAASSGARGSRAGVGPPFTARKAHPSPVLLSHRALFPLFLLHAIRPLCFPPVRAAKGSFRNRVSHQRRCPEAYCRSSERRCCDC